MKKVIAILLLSAPLISVAQSAFLEKARNRTKNKVEQRALNKIDKEVDKTLDGIENPSTGKTSNEKPKNEKPGAVNVSEPDEIKAYSKYDFVAGEKQSQRRNCCLE